MGLHDSYTKNITDTQEREAFAMQKMTIDDAFYEKFKNKYMVKFKLNDEYVNKIKKALPKSYKPDKAKIETQKRISEQLHEEIFATHVRQLFTPISRIVVQASASGSVEREMQAFYNYVYLHGTPENKEKIEKLANDIFEKKLKLQEEQKKQNNNDAIEDAREALYEANVAFERFGDSIFAQEMKRANEMVPRIKALMEETEPIEKLVENYREIRSYTSLFAEVERLKPVMENKLAPEEYDKIFKDMSSVQMLIMNYLGMTGFLANPALASNFDLTELKKISGSELENVLGDVFEWNIFGIEKPEMTEEEIEIANSQDSLEQKLINDLASENNYTYANWEDQIKDYFGVKADHVEVMTLDGERMTLSRPSMVKLYEDGRPFYAFPDTATAKEAVLCMPVEGVKLLCGKEAIKKMDTTEKEFNLQPPSELEIFIDQLISGLGGLFNKDWRLDSVRQYEIALEKHNWNEASKRYAKNIDELTSDPQVRDKAKRLSSLVRAERAEKEKEKIEAEAAREDISVEEYKAKKKVENILEKVEKREKQRSGEECAKEKKARENRVDKVRTLDLPKRTIRRMRLALENCDSLVQNIIIKPDEDWVKNAAQMMVVNHIMNQVDTMVENKSNNLTDTLAQICKDSKPEPKITAMVTSLMQDPVFKDRVNSLSEQDKMDIFGKGTSNEQRSKLNKFNSDFVKAKMVKEHQKEQAKEVQKEEKLKVPQKNDSVQLPKK